MAAVVGRSEYASSTSPRERKHDSIGEDVSDNVVRFQRTKITDAFITCRAIAAYQARWSEQSAPRAPVPGSEDELRYVLHAACVINAKVYNVHANCIYRAKFWRNGHHRPSQMPFLFCGVKGKF